MNYEQESFSSIGIANRAIATGKSDQVGYILAIAVSLVLAVVYALNNIATAIREQAKPEV